MTQLLVEDQPVPDDENAKKPAILKHQSIILTDDELKELGMKENAINNCEITEEEEFVGDAQCAENPSLIDEVENNLNEEDNHDMEATTPNTDDCSKELGIEGTDDQIEGNKNLDDVNADEIKNGNENNDVEAVDLVEPESELVNQEKPPKTNEKPKDIEQKQLTRPISGHKFEIPPMWTPANPRANAAFVYTFFRHVSLYYL